MVKIDIEVKGTIRVNADKDKASEIAQGIVFGYYDEEGKVKELPEDTEVLNYEDNVFAYLPEEADR